MGYCKALVLHLAAILSVLFLNACSAPNPAYKAVTQSINNDTLISYSESLATIGPRPFNDATKSEQTVQFIETKLHEFGYISQKSLGDATPYVNIVAEIRGTRQPNRIIELGAHYDTVPGCPGADDNGSGVSALLALAASLAQTKCSKTIRVVFYCGEEIGGIGSREHVRNILADQSVQVEGVIVLDPVGFATNAPESQDSPVRNLLVNPPRVGNFIAVIGNGGQSTKIAKQFEKSAELYESDLRLYSLKHIGANLKDAMRSDHAIYWQNNIPAIMLTDTGNYRNPNYHQPTDQIDTLNYAFMSQVARTTAATVLQWAGLETMVDHQNANSKANLVAYREFCDGSAYKNASFYKNPFDSFTGGMPTKGMSRDEASKKIVTDLWTAVIVGNDKPIRELMFNPEGQYPTFQGKNRPAALHEVNKPYWTKGCFDKRSTLIVPCKLEDPNGQTSVKKMVVRFFNRGPYEYCCIAGTWLGS